MNKRLVDEFLSDDPDLSDEEIVRVLDWLTTPEGQSFLARRFDSDILEVWNHEWNNIPGQLVPGMNSDKMLRRIHEGIGRLRKVPIDAGTAAAGTASAGTANAATTASEGTATRTGETTNSRQTARRAVKSSYLLPLIKVAASILVIATASLFTYSVYDPDVSLGYLAEPATVHYATTGEQQKLVTLSDGTQIRLNGDSELWIHSDISTMREVELTGEAFFDVVHNPDRPFLIRAAEANIEVLGTSFNVKTLEDEGVIQLAVVDGKVSFSTSDNGVGGAKVLLTGGQFGYLNTDVYTISVENFGVENYLAWMKGRLTFENLTLDQVCTLLGRIYSLECEFENPSLASARLSADFSAESVEKTLSVISLSLDISYQKDNSRVIWQESKQSDS